MQITPTQSNVQQALRTFLLAVLPATGSDGNAVAVVSGIQNRVAEPVVSNFVVMTPISFVRLGTNVDELLTATFTGSISGTVLTVTELLTGSILVGMTLNGTGTGTGAAATQITALGSGAGGTGTYTILPTVNGSGSFFASAKTMTQSARVVVQCDFHAADLTGGDMAQTVSTALRDEFGTSFFANLGLGVSPLHADDPRMTPFVNDQEQYEWRWTLDVHLQVDDTVTVPVEYATAASVTLKDVEALFPPG